MPIRKLEKAIVDVVIFLGTLCGAATIAEDEIEKLIKHTENILEDLQKPDELCKATKEQRQAFLSRSAELPI